MAKIAYKEINLGLPKLRIINQVNSILEDFKAQGYDMTLRQIYYQMIAGDHFPATWIDPVYNKKHGLAPDTKNTIKNYKRLGDCLNDARLAGHLDWLLMVDRTRALQGLAHWSSPEEIINAVAHQYRIDKWKDQKHRIEVWIEKDALSGVFDQICAEVDVPFFACKGYASQSEMWSAAMRLQRHRRGGQEPVILHFGDHDPSGIDMSRDIEDRLQMFMGKPVEFKRLALNMDQVKRYKAPPNPAKLTDSRASGYVEEFGLESWELDALTPTQMADLVRKHVAEIRDQKVWLESCKEEDHQKQILTKISQDFDRVEELFADEIEDRDISDDLVDPQEADYLSHAEECDGCEVCDPDGETTQSHSAAPSYCQYGGCMNKTARQFCPEHNNPESKAHAQGCDDGCEICDPENIQDWRHEDPDES